MSDVQDQKSGAARKLFERTKKLGDDWRERNPELIGKATETAAKALNQGKTLAKTKTGSRVLTGAAAGAAIGVALPLMTVGMGALLGAGVLVLWKSAKDGA